MATKHKYVMTKVAAGDYLLPSDDAGSVFRLQRYTDGPSLGLDDWPSDREVWRVSRWTGQVGHGCFIDTSPWSTRWEEVASALPTRRAAIDYALGAR